MARPRKPTPLLALAGAFKHNPQRLADRVNEPDLPKGIGEAPPWLDDVAKAEWWRVVPDLEAAGVTSRVEAVVLGAYCQAVSRLRAAEEQIATEGITINSPQGLKKHPAVGIAKEAMGIIRAFASEFGMTPASRSRVQSKSPGSQTNEFAD